MCNINDSIWTQTHRILLSFHTAVSPYLCHKWRHMGLAFFGSWAFFVNNLRLEWDRVEKGTIMMALGYQSDSSATWSPISINDLRGCNLTLTSGSTLYTVLKNEPIRNRYISRSSHDWKMIDISFKSELLNNFNSVPLFIRYKLRPWIRANISCPTMM